MTSRAAAVGTLVVAVWLVATVLLPYWTGPTIAGQFVPACLIASALSWAALTAIRRVRISVLDLPVLLLAALAIVALALPGGVVSQTVSVLGAWLLPYALGRTAAAIVPLPRFTILFAVAGVVLGLLGALELLLDWHPFVGWLPGTTTARIWSTIQYRGGLARSEWTLGHSIVFGNVVAMTIPALLRLPLRARLRYPVALIPLAGAAASFSRNAVVAAALAVALCAAVEFLPRLSRRVRITVLVAAACAAVGATAAFLVASASSYEVSFSTEYRLHYVDLLRHARLVGGAPTYRRFPDGTAGYLDAWYPNGVALSVDNTPLLTVLQLGWVALLPIAAVLVGIVVLLVRDPKQWVLITLASQIPTLLTLAMITQYSYVFWVLAGIAATLAASAGAARAGRERQALRREHRHLAEREGRRQ